MTPEEIKLYGEPQSIQSNCVTTVTHKRCPDCGHFKEHRQFGKNKASEFGLNNRCKSCSTIYTLICVFKRKYSLTLEQYADMYYAQNGLCMICKRTAKEAGSRKSLHVVHDHETGKVRGLLCQPCNTALGSFQDDPGLLISAYDYLTDR